MKDIKKICKVCEKTVTPIQRPGIGCCNCQSFFHFNCANLEEQDIEYIESNPVGWLCPKCNKPDRRSLIVPATPLKETAKGSSQSSGIASTSTAKINNPHQNKSTPAPTSKKSTQHSVLPTKASKKSTTEKAARHEPTNTAKKQKQQETVEVPTKLDTKSLKTEFESYKSSIASQLESLESQLSDLRSKLQTLSQNFQTLEADNSDLKNKVESLTDKSVESCVEISGIFIEKPDTLPAVIKIIGETIGCPLWPTDLKKFHLKTLSKKNPPHNIIVLEFNNQWKKELFLKAGRSFSRSRQTLPLPKDQACDRIFFNQQLTSHKKTLLYNTKEFAKLHNYKFVWIHKSQILLKKEVSAVPIYVRSISDLPTESQQ
jgi:hypothetical protein